MEKIKNNLHKIIASFVFLQTVLAIYFAVAAFWGFYRLNAMFFVKNASVLAHVAILLVVGTFVWKKKSWAVIPFWALIAIPLFFPLIRIYPQSSYWIWGLNIASSAYLSFFFEYEK